MFKVIPVLDLLNSIIVHAKKGERSKYRPLKSYLFTSNDVVEIINSLKDKFGFNMFYIADLDSITKLKPNFEIFKDIYQIQNVDFLIDPGIRNFDDLKLFKNFGLKKIIIGIETIERYEDILNGINEFGVRNIFLSIDLYQGLTISRDPALKNKNLLDLLSILEKVKVENIILLDLHRVGQKVGGIPPTYLKFRSEFKGTLFVGGGIKNMEDILLYKSKNFDGVLIGTSLYDGTIKPEIIKNLEY